MKNLAPNAPSVPAIRVEHPSPSRPSLEDEMRDVIEPAEQTDYTAIPDAPLAQSIFDAEALLAAIEERHAMSTAALRGEIAFMRAELQARMQEKHASILAHDDLEVTLTQKKVLDKRVDVLRKLGGVVPEEELAKGLTVELTISAPPHMLPILDKQLSGYVSPDKVKANWKADATKLKQLRKFGDDAAKILDEGLVHVPSGPPILSIKEKQQALSNVTPLQIGGAE